MAAAQIRRKATIVADYLGAHLRDHGRAVGAANVVSPLLVSMQGPQGCGKSSIANSLVDVLGKRGVRCTVASLDDFYLPHDRLKAVANAHPSNALLSGRGPPGTHDIELLSTTLSDLADGRSTTLPHFDKSLHGGEGDRSGQVPLDSGSVDVFLLEGWSLGFPPIRDSLVEQRHAASRVASTHPLASLLQINEFLRETETINSYFDTHVSIAPPNNDYSVVYAWRREQEHKMKEKNGGRGMSDDQVRAFVDRYMPVYEVWAESAQRPGLCITFGREREVLDVQERK